MKKYVAEFIGTFMILFVGTGSIIINEETSGSISHLGISICFGIIVMLMIYTLGSISGAHFNPAVTLAFSLVNKIEKKQVVPYIISQLIGGVLASFTLQLLFADNVSLGATIPLHSNFQAFVIEFFITFILMWVILHVALEAKEQSFYAALIIGTTVLLLALMAGPICGASMNPARSFAPALVSNRLEYFWIYSIAPILGACSSVLLFNYLTKNKNH